MTQHQLLHPSSNKNSAPGISFLPESFTCCTILECLAISFCICSGSKSSKHHGSLSVLTPILFRMKSFTGFQVLSSLHVGLHRYTLSKQLLPCDVKSRVTKFASSTLFPLPLGALIRNLHGKILFIISRSGCL